MSNTDTKTDGKPIPSDPAFDAALGAVLADPPPPTPSSVPALPVQPITGSDAITPEEMALMLQMLELDADEVGQTVQKGIQAAIARDSFTRINTRFLIWTGYNTLKTLKQNLRVMADLSQRPKVDDEIKVDAGNAVACIGNAISKMLGQIHSMQESAADKPLSGVNIALRPRNKPPNVMISGGAFQVNFARGPQPPPSSAAPMPPMKSVKLS